MIKAGDLVRVTKFYPNNLVLLPALGVGVGNDTVDFLCQSEDDDEAYTWPVSPDDMYRHITPDDLADEECAAVMKWMLSRGT